MIQVCSANSIVENASSIKSIVLRLHPGEDIVPTLVNFAQKNNLAAVTISTGVGSVHDCTLRLAESSIMRRFKGPFEVVSIVGTFSEDGLSHIHMALSDGETGKVIGGHLPQFPREGATEISDPSCKVRTTLEIVLLIHEGLYFKRPVDPETEYDELVVIHTPSEKVLDHRDEL